jgi:septal ring factor EnvC (AmiA/AmiB activator)
VGTATASVGSTGSAGSSESANIGDAHPAEAYDWNRLERAVGTLVDAHERLQRENKALRAELGDKNRHLRELDEQLMEASQRRQEVGKRIQELIAQIDHLDAQLGDREA